MVIKKCILCTLLVTMGFMTVQAQSLTEQKTEKLGSYGEKEDYRRSSLCLLLVTHQGEKYAQEMEKAFLNMPLPERYNAHNLSLRVIHTNNTLNEKNIEKILRETDVAKQLVSKWFDRNPSTGAMSLQTVHERGGRNASVSDRERSEMTVRGASLLQEEGDELIKNTFVLVCDMSYYDQAKTGTFLAVLGSVLSIAAEAYALDQEKKGKDATGWHAVSAGTAAGAVAASDLGGFSVKMKAHLLRLKWSREDLNKLYTDYWIDETTSPVVASQRKAAFDKDNSFDLEYIGSYKTRATSFAMKSASDLDFVMQEVTGRTVNKCMDELAKIFPVFKPKSVLVCKNGNYFTYLGTKENITTKTKFEVLQTIKKKNNTITYKKVATMGVRNPVWDNKNVRMDLIDNWEDIQGTPLYQKSGKKDLCDEMYVLREKGKSKLGNVKQHTFDVNFDYFMASYEGESLKDKIKSSYDRKKNLYGIKTNFNSVGRLSVGWTWNWTRYIGWNVLNGHFGLAGGAGINVGFGTGLTCRFPPMGKKQKTYIYAQPYLHYNYYMAHFEYSYTETYTHSEKYIVREYDSFWKRWKDVTKYRTYTTYETKTKDEFANLSFLDYGVKIGVDYKKFTASLMLGSHKTRGLSIGYHF